MRLIALAFAAAVLSSLPLPSGTAEAATESEPACLAGDAEACFYTGAEYAQVDGSGHLPMIDNADAVIALLKPFLERAGGGA